MAEDNQSCFKRVSIPLLFILIVLTVLLLIVVILFGIPYLVTKYNGDCVSPECIEISNSLTRNMDFNAEPCDDFAEFACGGFHNWNKFDITTVDTELVNVAKASETMNKELFELLYFNSTFREKNLKMNHLYSFTKSFYQSCILLFSTPLINTENKSTKNRIATEMDIIWDDVLDGVRKDQLTSFEAFLATQQLKNLQKGILVFEKLDWENFFAGQKSLLLWMNSFTRGIQHQFKKLESDVLELMNKSLTDWKSLDKINFSSNTAAIQSLIINLTTAIKNVKYEEFVGTFGELKRDHNDTGFDWDLFFNTYLGGKKIPEDTKIGVKNNGLLKASLKFFKGVNEEIKNKKTAEYPHHLALLTLWNLKERVNYLLKLKTEASLNTTMIASNCLQTVSDFLGPLVNQMYKQAYINWPFDSVRSLISEVTEAGFELVKEQTWISDDGKKGIIKKLKSMQNEVGFNEITDEHLLSYFSSLNNIKTFKVSADSFLTLYMLAEKVYSQSHVHFLTGADAVSMFLVPFLKPLQVNAYYNMLQNKMMFPIGILKPAFYHPKYPYYINLGGLGAIIGHEIGHGFDNDGHHYLSNGTRIAIWDNQTETEFLLRYDCLIKIYQKLEIATGEFFTSVSNYTMQNNIADAIGLSMAFRVLSNKRKAGKPLQFLPGVIQKYTPEQLFFIQAAQPWCSKATDKTMIAKYGNTTDTKRIIYHSPGMVRLRGMMKNNPDFAKAFQCKKGAPMNPEPKCIFW